MIRENDRLSSRLVVGLMSGTSADGIDAVLTRIHGTGMNAKVTLLHHSFTAYPESIRSLLLENPAGLPARDVASLNFQLGELFAQAALTCLEAAGVRREDVDLIASHGQTIVHLPPESGFGATLQIGELSVIAARTGITTVGDFRPSDIAVGGQGAPLVPFADYVLFRHERKGRIILNIGGIANLTYLPPGAGIDKVLAFDTGPGNMVLDGLVYLATSGRIQMDEGGKLALAGKLREDILAKLLEDLYFAQSPPKSTGREKFGRHYAKAILETWPGVPLEDLVRTAAELTVRSVVDSIRMWVSPKGPVHELVLGGGGARNRLFLTRLPEELPGLAILTHQDLGIDDKAKEALAFAILGNETLVGNPNNVPSATGARLPVCMGKICFPPRRDGKQRGTRGPTG